MSSSHSTPSKAATAKSKSKASSSSRSSSRMFTPAMQDRQARNKNPYSSSDESSDSAWEGQNRKFDVYDYSRDSFARIQRRREAAIVLDNPELLMMHAQARSDSIPGTRHYFTKILCGYEDDKDPHAPVGVEIYEKPKFRPSKEANETKRSM